MSLEVAQPPQASQELEQRVPVEQQSLQLLSQHELQSLQHARQQSQQLQALVVQHELQLLSAKIVLEVPKTEATRLAIRNIERVNFIENSFSDPLMSYMSVSQNVKITLHDVLRYSARHPGG